MVKATVALSGAGTPQATRSIKYGQSVPLKVPVTNNGNVTITPPTAGTPSNPTFYLLSSFTGTLTIEPNGSNQTYVAIHVTGDITGNLTIRGITNEITLHAEVQGTDIDPWGNTRIGLEVTGQLSRADYGMTFNQALRSGNMLVGDKVNLALDISAVKAA